MALSLRDVRCDPIANRALNELMHHYTVAQEKSRLVLTKKTGEMKLFLNDLDDLHQWDFTRNQQMVKEIERLRVLLTTTNQHRESWKVRALMAEAQLLEATAKTGNKGDGAENVSDVRYASPASSGRRCHAGVSRLGGRRWLQRQLNHLRTYDGWMFPPGSSGPFGDDLPGRWLSYEELHITTEAFARMRQDDPRAVLWASPGLESNPFWADLHARSD